MNWNSDDHYRIKGYLPYIFFGIGLLLSLLLWYILRIDIQPSPYPKLETYHPWLALILGILISMLVASIIRITQLSQHRALTLKHMNEDLKKEISERVIAQETKQKLETALLEGQKLQAIGTLAGGIAHDFNNILYAIIGYVQIVREDVGEESLAYQNLGKILEAAIRGQELVARILAFSRRQHHHFDEIELNSSIDAILSLLRPTIPASVTIKFVPHAAIKILGNQTQIHQVLVNLINNAVDAMDGEGTITIDMDRVIAGDAFLQQFPETKGKNYCKIQITDTGQGIDLSTKERIFEPFFTTKEVGKGTGLGLSIAHSIIKEHAGEITVQSRLGRGTTFTILLPEV